MPIIIKLDLTKIDKSRIFEGKKGKYLDLILMENRDGEDQYGNAGFCAHSVTKEEREAGERGSIVGNFKYIGAKPSGSQHSAAPAARQTARPPARAQKPAPDPDLDSSEQDDIPF